MLRCLLLVLCMPFATLFPVHLRATSNGSTDAAAADTEELKNLRAIYEKYGAELDEQKMRKFSLMHLPVDKICDVLFAWVSHNLDEIERVSTDEVKATCFEAIKKTRECLRYMEEIIRNSQLVDSAQILAIIDGINRLHETYSKVVTLFMGQVSTKMQFAGDIEIEPRLMHKFVFQILAKIFEKTKDNELVKEQLREAINNLVKELRSAASQEESKLATKQGMDDKQPPMEQQNTPAAWQSGGEIKNENENIVQKK
ncbi:MAG: hypothetical protein LBT90_01080 [Holosporaceae bacterium]|nr:hypothetical protein [Holosporaceae bacterium]